MFGWTRGLIGMIALLAMPASAAPQTQALAPTSVTSRVRSRSAVLLSVMARASKMSPTFRGLMETINASDGIVLVEPGMCRHGVLACLVNIATVAGQRVVFVRVAIKKSERDLMASIG